MSDNQKLLLPGTSYSTKDQVIRLIGSANDQSIFFIHFDFIMRDQSARLRRTRTFLQVTRDQAKVFVETTASMVDPDDDHNRMRVRITQHTDELVAYNSIWIG